MKIKVKTIKSIKEQAFVNVALSYGYGDTPECKRDISWFNPDSPSIQEKIDEEFAKLIVKECALVIKRANETELDPIFCIEQYFGVK